MLEACLRQGSLFKKVFDAIREMVPEVNLECTATGIQLQAMDSSHVSLVSLDLKENAFEAYRCDRARSLGLNMAAVAKVFKHCGNDDAVIIRHVDDQDKMSFVFEAAGEDRVSDFDLKLMSIEQEHLSVPESEFPAQITLPSKQFQRICNDLGQFSDSLTIEASHKLIKFSATGDMVGGNVTLRSRESNEERVEIETESPTYKVQLSFAVRYLNYFSKAAPLASHVQLKLAKNLPLEVTFYLNDNSQIGRLRFYLAPKMEESDADSQSAEPQTF